MRINSTGVLVRALAVEHGEDVGLTADEAQVSLDALSQLHATVRSVRHHNHLVVTARRREHLVTAVL